MSSIYNNSKRRTQTSATTPQNRSQRATCNVVIYRWAEADISKISVLEAKNERGFAGQGQAPTEGNFETDSRLIIRNDVIRCNTSKSKSNPTGTFSVTLKQGKIVRENQVLTQDINYLNLVNPGDWIMIYMKKSGTVDYESTSETSGLKMVGIIENVRYTEIEDPETGKPTLAYLITGQDVGKPLTNSIFFNPLLNPQTVNTFLGAKFLTDAIDTVKGIERNTDALSTLNPQNVVKKLLGFYLGKSEDNQGTDLDDLNSTNQTWYVPPNFARLFGIDKKDKALGVSFSDILQTNKIGLHKYNKQGQLQSVNPLPGINLVKNLPSSGTVWSVLNMLSNSTLNEMYVELLPDANKKLRPNFVLRQLPFSNRDGDETNIFTRNAAGRPLPREINIGERLVNNPSDKTFFVNLPKHTINSSDIKQKNIGKSDHERINHLIVVPKIDTNAINVAFISALNAASVQRYGLKSFQSQSSYVLGSKFGNLKKTCQAYVELMIDWFFLGHLFYNGTLIIQGQDKHIPVGDNLYIEDIQQLFHIESVTHTFDILPNGGTRYETQLAVTRGQFYDNSKAKFIGPSSAAKEQTTIATSTLEGIRN